MELYNRSKLDKIKYKFQGIETIDQNYSQSYQDIFILSMLNGKKNGTFLEIGAHHAEFISNTYLLESKFNWSGISIDIVDCDFSNRKAKFIKQDALKVDYKKLLSENFNSNQIDYLQIDIEPMEITFECLKKIPFSDYRFSVITYETDYYCQKTSVEKKEYVKSKSRDHIQSHGYELVVGDVCNIGNDPFEDWYIDPTVISDQIYKYYTKDVNFNKKAEQFIFL